MKDVVKLAVIDPYGAFGDGDARAFGARVDGEDGAFDGDVAVGGGDLQGSVALFGRLDDDVAEGQMDGCSGISG